MIWPSAQELTVSAAARSDALTKGCGLMFRSGQTKPSYEVCAMLAEKE
jgi:hypothetical protein